MLIPLEFQSDNAWLMVGARGEMGVILFRKTEARLPSNLSYQPTSHKQLHIFFMGLRLQGDVGTAPHKSLCQHNGSETAETRRMSTALSLSISLCPSSLPLLVFYSSIPLLYLHPYFLPQSPFSTSIPLLFLHPSSLPPSLFSSSIPLHFLYPFIPSSNPSFFPLSYSNPIYIYMSLFIPPSNQPSRWEDLVVM